MKATVGVLTVSDRAAAGEYEDVTGALIADMIGLRTGWLVTHRAVVDDTVEKIASTLIQWCDEDLSLILTNGGTGFSPRDVTPDATRQVLDREAPGIPEALRQVSLRYTQHAMLSRAVAGIRARTLIINLPGSPKAVRENLDVLFPVLPHALELLSGGEGSLTGHRSA